MIKRICWICLLFLICSGCNDAVEFKSPDDHPNDAPITNPNIPSGGEENIGDKNDIPMPEPDLPDENGQTGNHNSSDGSDKTNSSEPDPNTPDNSGSQETPDVPDDTEDLNPAPDDNEHVDHNAGNASDGTDEPDTVDPASEIAQPLEADGLTNFYRVSTELYRSGQPVAGGLISAKELGIKTVLSLQIISIDAALEKSEQSGLELVHVSMVPSTVSQDDIVKALRQIRLAEKPVLVHCTHGSDRTGITVAMYRMVFQNWSKERAKAEMLEEQFGYHAEFDNLLTLIDEIDVEALKTRIFSDEEE